MKRYRDYASYLKEIFGERVQKISLDAGLGCPNRDADVAKGGCLFCDECGSGTGALVLRGLSIAEQISQAKRHLSKRYKVKKFIAYFQSFTNTYAPISRLKSLYDEALLDEDIVGLSVATRPDCVNSETLVLLSSYGGKHLTWIEYGLQSAHDSTLRRINRGHDVAAFERGLQMARKFGLDVCVHVILGLPGEDRAMMLQTARFLADLPISGVKIHLLYVVKGASLAALFTNGDYRCLERQEYVELVVDFLEILPPDVVVQRLTGDPPASELLAPHWAQEKTKNLQLIRETFERRNTWQGRLHVRSSVRKCS